MKKIDKVIEYFRNLREEGMVVGSGETSLGYNLETESPPVKKKRENKKYIYSKGLRSWWRQNTQ
jgi:hypothetical protein